MTSVPDPHATGSRAAKIEVAARALMLLDESDMVEDAEKAWNCLEPETQDYYRMMARTVLDA